MKQTVKLSEYTTNSTNTENGTHNMALSLAAANGTVLKPGEIFSFNETTGDTTTGALGYLPATGISNNKSVQVYGGGICQSSTTIYGAALRADMEIVTRYNHRWPSSYVPIGQDATVDYPSTDFQFKNSSDYPVISRPIWMEELWSYRFTAIRRMNGILLRWKAGRQASFRLRPPSILSMRACLRARSHGGPMPATAIPQRAKRCFIKTARRSKGSQLIPRITWRAPRSIK